MQGGATQRMAPKFLASSHQSILVYMGIRQLGLWIWSSNVWAIDLLEMAETDMLATYFKIPKWIATTKKQTKTWPAYAIIHLCPKNIYYTWGGASWRFQSFFWLSVLHIPRDSDQLQWFSHRDYATGGAALQAPKLAISHSRPFWWSPAVIWNTLHNMDC